MRDNIDKYGVPITGVLPLGAEASMLVAKGKLIRQGDDPARPSRTVLYIPVDVARDSSFPFPKATEVTVAIDVKTRQLRISEA